MDYIKEEGSIVRALINDHEYSDVPQSRMEALVLELIKNGGGGGGGGEDISSITPEELAAMWGDTVPTDPTSGMSPVTGDEIDHMWDGTYDDGDGADPGTLTPEDIAGMWGD